MNNALHVYQICDLTLNNHRSQDSLLGKRSFYRYILFDNVKNLIDHQGHTSVMLGVYDRLD